MASAYVGCLLLPPLFGIIANHINAKWLPWYLAAILVVMVIMCEVLNKKTEKK
jgi:fucose permease